MWPNICTALLTQYTQYFNSISVYPPLLGYTMQDLLKKQNFKECGQKRTLEGVKQIYGR